MKGNAHISCIVTVCESRFEFVIKLVQIYEIVCYIHSEQSITIKLHTSTTNN